MSLCKTVSNSVMRAVDIASLGKRTENDVERRQTSGAFSPCNWMVSSAGQRMSTLDCLMKLQSFGKQTGMMVPGPEASGGEFLQRQVLRAWCHALARMASVENPVARVSAPSGPPARRKPGNITSHDFIKERVSLFHHDGGGAGGNLQSARRRLRIGFFRRGHHEFARMRQFHMGGDRPI